MQAATFCKASFLSRTTRFSTGVRHCCAQMNFPPVSPCVCFDLVTCDAPFTTKSETSLLVFSIVAPLRLLTLKKIGPPYYKGKSGEDCGDILCFPMGVDMEAKPLFLETVLSSYSRHSFSFPPGLRSCFRTAIGPYFFIFSGTRFFIYGVEIRQRRSARPPKELGAKESWMRRNLKQMPSNERRPAGPAFSSSCICARDKVHLRQLSLRGYLSGLRAQDSI